MKAELEWVVPLSSQLSSVLLMIESNRSGEIQLPSRGTRVLIVDDNQTNRRIMFEMCTNWGMTPVVSTGATEALRLLKAAKDEGKPFQLILSDVNMPEIDGFTMAEQIRGSDGFGNTQIIMLTSSGRPGDAQRRRELGIEASLLKPVKQSELLDTITTVLQPDDEEQDAHVVVPDPQQSVHVTGLKILLAEDNLVNQKLAMGILAKQHHDVTVVSNGAEAVEEFQRGDFDVVLMDVQMPVMDGFTATREIRVLQTNDDKRIPIIAMTAHAMKGDRERCLESGMDEYLSKPIRSEQLASMLDRMVPNAGSEKESSASGAEATPNVSDVSGETAPSSGEQMIDRDAALASVDGDWDLLKMVLEAFLQEYVALFNKIRKTHQAGETAELKKACHTAKGAMLSIGALELAGVARQIEEMDAQADTSTVDGQVNELLAKAPSLAREITAMINSGSS